MRFIKKIIPIQLLFLFAALIALGQAPVGKQWSVEKAKEWFAAQPWMVGANYLPSNAINQLEMWQAATFDSLTNDKELGWAKNIGMNTLRVYLHSLAWEQDKEGFKRRINTFLNIANRHNIRIIFVFFDDCWNKVAVAGKQPEPKPGIHNSGWVQDPGQDLSSDTTIFPKLEIYVKDILNTFGRDKRIILWDLYNEPGNSGKRDSSLPLVKKVFEWARTVNPDQPLSIGLWAWDFEKLNEFQLRNSDVFTYHNYEDAPWHQRTIELFKTNGRPMICTEYMARTRNSRFANILPLLRQHNIGAINWGLVAGKSNTKYAWDTPIADGGEPVEWFHDIFNPDGTSYRKDETDLIKKLASQK